MRLFNGQALKARTIAAGPNTWASVWSRLDSTNLRVGAAFVVLAVLVRLPTFIYPSTSWDEGLYWVIAAGIKNGELPYVTAWDRKPVGIFLVYALADWLFANAVFGIRLIGALFTGFAAYGLYRLAVTVFVAGELLGVIAGAAFILFSLQNGGMWSNAEIFYVPLSVVGLYLAVQATVGPAAAHPGRRAMGLAASGLVLGLGFQIKYSVAFDLPAVAAACVLLSGGASAGIWQRTWAALGPLSLIGSAAALPTLAVIALYAWQGQLDVFLTANLTANAVYHELAYGHWTRLVAAMANHGPLWVGAGLALLCGPRLAKSSRERRMLLVAGLWIVTVLVGIAYLRLWYHNYFFQLLPPLCLLNGYIVGRCIESMRNRLPQAVALSLLAVYAFFVGGKPMFLTAGDLIIQRWRNQNPAWGDTVKLVARDLQSTLSDGATIYVFDHNPLLYYLLEKRPPTRYASPDHLFSASYGLIDPFEELNAIVEQRPEVIVTQDSTFTPAAETGPADSFRAPLTRVLQDLLEREYVLERSYPPVDAWDGRTLSMGAWGAKLYRRRPALPETTVETPLGD